MTWEARLDIKGKCRHCGRIVPARLKQLGGVEAEGECPRCGHTPFYIDRVMAYVNDIASMDLQQALDFAGEVESQEDIEVLIRVEILGPDRDQVMHRLMDRYEEIDDRPDIPKSKPALTLDELRAEVRRQFDENPDWIWNYRGAVKDLDDEPLSRV